jgi:hypothetical protein
MLAYKYVPNPKLGDLLGYSSGNEIRPGIIAGFSKNGNIQILFLMKHLVDRYKQGKPADKKGYWYSPIKTVAKNHLSRVILIDKNCLDPTELGLYNSLVNPKP